jgi:hypothetical protein
MSGLSDLRCGFLAGTARVGESQKHASQRVLVGLPGIRRARPQERENNRVTRVERDQVAEGRIEIGDCETSAAIPIDQIRRLAMILWTLP